MEWIFDGIGTSIVTFILGIFFGGSIGYNIAINKESFKQKQKAGNNSLQIQTGRVSDDK